MHPIGRASVVAVFALLVGTATASAADAANGERLARRWCMSCHVVTPSQHLSSADAAPFSAIAATPGFNEALLAFFLLDPHPKMPDMSLSRTEAADLAAYIGKQK